MKALVVGYGSIGKRHVKNLLTIPNMEVIVCTKKSIRDEQLKKCIVVNSLFDGIKLNPNFAVICNITKDHVNTALHLAKSGIHLFIEKPLSNTLTNVDKLSKIVKSKKLITMIGCNMRFHKAISLIKDLIYQEKIGKVLSVKVENGSFLPDWHPQENYTKGYAAQKKLGGGVVLTNIHEVDYLYWIFGMPKEVYGITRKLSDLKVFEDLSSVLMNYNNMVVEIHLDFFQRPPIRSCKIIGTKGTIYWDSNINQVKLFDVKKNHWLILSSLNDYDYNLMYVDEIKYFINCIKKKNQTMNNLNNSINTLKISLSILRSFSNHKVVHF